MFYLFSLPIDTRKYFLMYLHVVWVSLLYFFRYILISRRIQKVWFGLNFMGLWNFSFQIDILCNDELLGKDHTLKFVCVTRWRFQSPPLLLQYRPHLDLWGLPPFNSIWNWFLLIYFIFYHFYHFYCNSILISGFNLFFVFKFVCNCDRIFL